MWVKSQDKTKLIDVEGKKIFVIDTIVYVDLLTGEESVTELANYDSSEQAIAILGDIEQAIISDEDLIFCMPES